MAGRLEGRRVLVVGGGQQDYGIEDPPPGNGRAMSVLFAREGAAVAVADLDAASAEATVALVREAGAQGLAVTGDAADEADLERMFEEARSGLGGLDGLVMNVGIGGGLGFAGTTVEDWDRVLAVNLRSHFLGCKQALATFGEGASVVLIGSLAGRESMPYPAYAASKAALEAVCRNAAVEGAPRLRVNLLVPGLIDTSLGRLATSLNPARGQVRIPAGRQGSAWEVAQCALFLLSDESSYVTGQPLVVDGGLSVAVRS
ncbi:MAG TPA: SDR family oxidoreductase [Solirubrobacteraceae bacterium]|jgi:NAD(P)-dependent dehydrogenase (short-subunit alcohol dehydrogenase family)